MRIATFNLGDGPDFAKSGGLTRLRERDVDIIGLQEAGDRHRMIDRWCEFTGWRAWFGEGPGAASVPILWNPRTVRARHTGTTPATPATKVGPFGAGPSTMKAKVWNRARFASDAGTVAVINGHIVPSIYLPKRRRLAEQQIDVLAEMVQRRKGKVPVVAIGDFNMKAHHDLADPLRELGMVQRTKQPTHGNRIIDHVWTLGIKGDVDVLEMPSDHRAAILTIKEHR